MSVETPAAMRIERLAPALDVPAARARAFPRVDLILMLVLFAMAIVPRAAWVAYNDRPPQALNDPTMYDLLSDIMANGDGYTRPTGEPWSYRFFVEFDHQVGDQEAEAVVREVAHLVG